MENGKAACYNFTIEIMDSPAAEQPNEYQDNFFQCRVGEGVLPYLDDLVTTYKIKIALANQLATNRKFKEAKQAFDEYFEARDFHLRESCIKTCESLCQNHQSIDPSFFKPAAKLSTQDLVKFKEEMKHFEKDVILKIKYAEGLSLDAIQKIILPSVLHLQLELINHKISFYRQIGLEKEVAELAKLLIFSNKSSLFPVPNNSYDAWMEKINKTKKEGNTKKVIEIIKEAIGSFKDEHDSLQKSLLYQKLAQFSRETDKDGHEVLSAFDKAILLSKYKKVQISQQRKAAFKELCKILPIENHKGLIKYFDDSIKNSVEVKLTNLLIEKATFFKSMGDLNQAFKSYSLAVQSVPKEQSKRKIQVLRQQAFFLVENGKVTEAMKAMEQVDFLNPTDDPSRFLRKIIQFKHLDASVKNYFIDRMCSKSLYRPFGCDTQHYSLNAFKAEKSGNLAQAVELLKKGISSTEDPQEKCEFYEVLANFMKKTDQDGFQIMTAYDKAISHARFDRVKLTLERRQALWKVASKGSLQSHKGLLKYFEELPKTVKKHKHFDVYVEKAQILKKFGDSTQAIKAYSQAIECAEQEQKANEKKKGQVKQQKEISLNKVLVFREYANFLADLGKVQQAAKIMIQAEKMNPSNDSARFLRRVQQNIQLDASTKKLIQTQISETSLHYPYGCDTEQFLHQAMKARKAGNPGQAVELLKKGISLTEDNYLKSELYEYMAIVLKETDKDGSQIIRAYDKAIAMTIFDRARLTIDRKLAVWQLSLHGTVDSHKGLAKYFEDLPKHVKKAKVPQSHLERADFLKKLGDTAQAIKALTQAIQSVDSKEFVWKSELLKKQACWLKQSGKKEEAMATFDQALQVYDSKSNDKIRFLCSMQMFAQAEKIAEKSNDPYKLRTIAILRCTEGDKLRQTTNNVTLIREKFLTAVSLYDRAIKLVYDFAAIKKFLEEQALAFRKAYNFSEIEDNVIEKHQDKLLAEMGIIEDFKFLCDKFDKKDSEVPQSGEYNFKKQIPDNKLLNFNFLEPFSLKTLFGSYPIEKCAFYFIETMTLDLVDKLWNSGRQLESYKVFQKTVFIKHQNFFISEHECHAVLRKTYEAKRQYRLQNFRECLMILKSISSFPSIETSVNVPIARVSSGTQGKDFNAFLQQSQALNLWNVGKYDLACKIFADMVIFSGKNVSYFVQESNPEAQQCKTILKYNAILYAMGQKNYDQCVKKIRKFEKLMTKNLEPIKDSGFYIKFATVYFEIAKKFELEKSDKSTQMYCAFLDQFKKADEMQSIPKDHEVYKLLRTSINALQQTFRTEVRNVGEQVKVFRDLCFGQDKKSLVYDNVKDYIQKINNSLEGCFKIKQFGIIQNTSKVDSLNALKECWNQTCYIVYKEVINKDVSGDLNDVRKLIEELREEMKTISKNQGKTIDNDSLAKLPQVMTELKNESVDEYEALIKSKTNDALSQIEKAYDQIRRSLSSMNGQTQNMPSDEIIAKLVGDNLAMKEQNQTFNELIDDLQRQIDEKNAQKPQEPAKISPQNANPSQEKEEKAKIFGLDEILAMIDSSKTSMMSRIEQMINGKISEINKAYEALKQNMESLIHNSSQGSSPGVENGEVLNALIAGHQNMKEENEFFKSMLDQALDQTDNLTVKLQEYQKVIAGLQNLTKSSISLQQIQNMLREFAEKNIYTRITVESQQLVNKLIGKTQQGGIKQNDMQKAVHQYINKNFVMLLDYVSEILDPLNDGNVDKYFKRFKDDLLIRDNRIKYLEDLLKDYQAKQNNAKLSKQVEEQIRKLQQQAQSSKIKLQNVSNDLKKILDKISSKTDQEDLRKLKQEILATYKQNEDVVQKLDLLSTDTLVGNYHDLLDHLDYLKNYIAVNDKKINILSNKLGTKIVTSFNGILRNDDVKFDKHGKLRFQPQKQEIRVRVESRQKQNQRDNKENLVSTIPGSLQKKKKSLKKSSLHGSSTLFRTRPISDSKFKVTEVSKVIDKGRKNVEMEGEMNRRLNVVIMQNSQHFDY